MDGENSKISNSYLLRNLSMTTNKENYGGGAYMIQGTGYNLVVANNRCGNGAQSYGGGIFLESAKFYNNTIAYNMSAYGTGIYHWQDQSTGVPSQLSLYNCLIYDNHNGNKEVADQVNSLAWDKMKPSHNCYMNSSDDNKNSLKAMVTSPERTWLSHLKTRPTKVERMKFSASVMPALPITSA